MIESVVALAILALTLSVIYPIFGWTLRHAADQRQRNWAWLTAQSLLDQIRADRSLAVGRRDGQTPQGQTWEAVVEPFAQHLGTSPALGLVEVATPIALQVTVRVNWGEQPSHHIELRSIELGAVR